MDTSSLPAIHSSTVEAATSALQVAGGIAFVVFWFIAAGVWAMMSLMGSLMANDAGRVSAAKHMRFLYAMAAGEVLAALAGVPGGLAFFWTSQRSALLWLFGGLFVTGITLQFGAFAFFFRAAQK